MKYLIYPWFFLCAHKICVQCHVRLNWCTFNHRVFRHWPRRHSDSLYLVAEHVAVVGAGDAGHEGPGLAHRGLIGQLWPRAGLWLVRARGLAHAHWLPRPPRPLPGRPEVIRLMEVEVTADDAADPLRRPRSDDLHLFVDVLEPPSHSVRKTLGWAEWSLGIRTWFNTPSLHLFFCVQGFAKWSRCVRNSKTINFAVCTGWIKRVRADRGTNDLDEPNGRWIQNDPPRLPRTRGSLWASYGLPMTHSRAENKMFVKNT